MYSVQVNARKRQVSALFNEDFERLIEIMLCRTMFYMQNFASYQLYIWNNTHEIGYYVQKMKNIIHYFHLRKFYAHVMENRKLNKILQENMLE